MFTDTVKYHTYICTSEKCRTYINSKSASLGTKLHFRASALYIHSVSTGKSIRLYIDYMFTNTPKYHTYCFNINYMPACVHVYKCKPHPHLYTVKNVVHISTVNL